MLRGYVRDFCGGCRFCGGVGMSFNLLKDFETDTVNMDGEFIRPPKTFVPFDVAVFLKSGKVTLHGSFAHGTLFYKLPYGWPAIRALVIGIVCQS